MEVQSFRTTEELGQPESAKETRTESMEDVRLFTYSKNLFGCTNEYLKS